LSTAAGPAPTDVYRLFCRFHHAFQAAMDFAFSSDAA
jgi:hypothetical protein